MRLILTLEKTGEVWILDEAREYSVGSHSTCDITLASYKKYLNSNHLSFSFDSVEQLWRVNVLPGQKQTLINDEIVALFFIRERTRITLGAEVIVNATPATRPTYTPQDIEPHPKSEISSRLISGSAYLRGLGHSLKLLDFLRTDPYKADSPETSLDLEEISTHVSQAILLFLICACVGISVLIIQLLAGIFRDGLLGGITAWSLTWSSSNWLAFIARMFATGNNGGDRALSLMFALLDFFAAFILAYELVFMRWFVARKFLKREKYRSSYRSDFHIKLAQNKIFRKILLSLKKRTRKIDPFQNIITFGGFKPFLGAGEPIDNSDIAVSIDRQTVSDTPVKREKVDLPVSEFYNAVQEEILKLDLPKLQSLPQLYVKGFELDQDDVILYGRLTKPISILPEEDVWSIGQGDQQEDRRAYQVYRYVDEKRDNVMSYFVRFYNIGSITFMEAVAYGLTSFDRREYSLSSVLKDNLFLKIVETFPVFAVLSQFRLYLIVAGYQLGRFLYSIFKWWRYELQARRAARLHEEYNYGLQRTFRESVSAPFDSSYYGNQDMIMYWKAIQQAVFRGVLNVLRENNLNTSQFETSVRAITNYGIMVTGGSLNASQVAVGQNASAFSNRAGASGRGGFAGNVIGGLSNSRKP